MVNAIIAKKATRRYQIINKRRFNLTVMAPLVITGSIIYGTVFKDYYILLFKVLRVMVTGSNI